MAASFFRGGKPSTKLLLILREAALKKPPELLQQNLPKTFMYQDLGRNLALFDNLIRQRGYEVEVTPHVICPCITPARSGGISSADPDCPACHGQGIAFLEDNKTTVYAIVTGISASDPTDLKTGYWSEGRFQVTFASAAVVEEGDRLLLPKAPMTVRFNRKYNESVGGLRLPFRFEKVTRAVILDPGTRLPITLVAGQDFTTDCDKRFVAFPPRGRVAGGMVVSFLFEAFPYFMVQSFMSHFRGQSTYFTKDGREAFAQLPKSAIAVRADKLFGQAEYDVAEYGDATKDAP